VNRDTISFRLLYGFLILQHSRELLWWLGVTARPSADWIARQLTEAYGWGSPFPGAVYSSSYQ